MTMKRLRAIGGLGALLLMLCLLPRALEAASYLLVHGQVGVSLAAVTAAGPGDDYALSPMPDAGVRTYTWTVEVGGGPPATLQADLQGSIDARQEVGCAVTSGAAALVCTTGDFGSQDLGKPIEVTGAGAAGALLSTTISVVTNGTHVTLAGNAGTTVTAQTALLGNWYQLDTTSTVGNQMRHVVNKPVRRVRIKLIIDRRGWRSSDG